MVVVCSQPAFKGHDASVGDEKDASVGDENDASAGDENDASVGEENAGNGTDYSHDIDKELQAVSESQGARNAKMFLLKDGWPDDFSEKLQKGLGVIFNPKTIAT